MYTDAQLSDIICMALGGRAAEQIIFGEVSTGASDDLRRYHRTACALCPHCISHCRHCAGRAHTTLLLIFWCVCVGRVTEVAYSTVTLYGMSDRIGHVSFPPDMANPEFVKPYSEQTAQIIDEEVRNKVANIYTRALQVRRCTPVHAVSC